MNGTEHNGPSTPRWVDALGGVALVVTAAAAAVSVAITMDGGRLNPSRMLVAAFVLWVVSPFVALSVAHGAAKRWTASSRTVLYVVMLVIALASLALYGARLLWPPRAQAAFVFVVLPPASWAFAAIVLAGAAAVRRRAARGPTPGRVRSGGV